MHSSLLQHSTFWKPMRARLASAARRIAAPDLKKRSCHSHTQGQMNKSLAAHIVSVHPYALDAMVLDCGWVQWGNLPHAKTQTTKIRRRPKYANNTRSPGAERKENIIWKVTDSQHAQFKCVDSIVIDKVVALWTGHCVPGRTNSS
jgi:hypothetical protein